MASSSARGVANFRVAKGVPSSILSIYAETWLAPISAQKSTDRIRLSFVCASVPSMRSSEILLIPLFRASFIAVITSFRLWRRVSNSSSLSLADCNPSERRFTPASQHLMKKSSRLSAGLASTVISASAVSISRAAFIIIATRFPPSTDGVPPPK